SGSRRPPRPEGVSHVEYVSRQTVEPRGGQGPPAPGPGPRPRRARGRQAPGDAARDRGGDLEVRADRRRGGRGPDREQEPRDRAARIEPAARARRLTAGLQRSRSKAWVSGPNHSNRWLTRPLEVKQTTIAARKVPAFAW